MYIAKKEIEDRLADSDKVLDIGSWNDIFPRANVIIDVNPFETRKNNYQSQKECFTHDSWIQADVNKIDTWLKFKDKEFDFAICSHLLEDVRDPLFVCQQMIRVAKSGYIEVPTRFRECSRADPYDTVSGYDHHRWLVDVMDGNLVFTAKLHWAHTIDYLTDEKRSFLNFHNFHYLGVFWNNNFSFHERCPKGELLEGANLLYQFDRLDISKLKEVGNLSTTVGDGGLLWVDQFSLPIEREERGLVEVYIQKYQKLSKGARHCDAQHKENFEEIQNLSTNSEFELVATRKKLNDVLKSKSWRITAPLRAVMTLVSTSKNFLKLKMSSILKNLA